MSGAVAKPRGKRRANDAYYTPDELANRLVGLLPVQPTDLALEPSAGGGAFVRALQARGALVCGVDIDPDSVGVKQAQHHAWTGDFRDHEWNDPPYDWIVGNPPYKDAQLHVQHALDNTGRHVAMLLRMGFLAGQQRQRELCGFYPSAPASQAGAPIQPTTAGSGGTSCTPDPPPWSG